MQELVGRITALDPEASETLRVIAYFDALVDNHASIEALLRAATVLSGCAAGVSAGDTVLRVDESGVRSPTPAAPAIGDFPHHVVAEDWFAWLERPGSPHVNDEMILERLSLGLAIALERTHPVAIARRNLEILIDPTETPDNHASAAARLRLGEQPVRLLAVPVGDRFDGSSRSVTLSTAFGGVRAILVTESDPSTMPSRCGVGVPTNPIEAALSWTTALLALRMTHPGESIVDASALGSFLLLAEAADSAPPGPDVLAIGRLVEHDPTLLDQLEMFVRAESIRAAALAARVHHSTMQARVADLGDRMGFDIRTGDGRLRLTLALRLYRLASSRFPEAGATDPGS